jgi:hypothetical protein
MLSRKANALSFWYVVLTLVIAAATVIGLLKTFNPF